MTGRLIIDCGAADTRAAYLVDDEPWRFWFGPARGDERLPRPPSSGDIFAGRVRAVSKSLNGAFVDIGAGRDAFLPFLKNSKPPTEGAAIIAKVRRPPIGAKGAVLTTGWSKDLTAEARAAIQTQANAIGVGALGELSDAALQASIGCRPDQAQGAPELTVNDPAAKKILEEYWRSSVRLEGRPFEATLIGDALAEALSQILDLPGGARIAIHETEAGALFDVDAASSAEGSTGILADKTNRIAAERIMIELLRRDIGGRVIIDFLPPSGAPARAMLAEFLKERLMAISQARFGKIAPDGLCDFTLPRRRLSLLERASERAGGAGWLVGGRRMTLDWAAKAAIRTLENALIAQPSARRRLIVSADIGDYLRNERSQWAQRLLQRYGARFTIETTASKEMRAHEIV